TTNGTCRISRPGLDRAKTTMWAPDQGRRRTKCLAYMRVCTNVSFDVLDSRAYRPWVGIAMKRLSPLTARALLLAALAASGCARAASNAGRQSERTFCAKSTATVYVQNDNWMDVVVYAVRGGARFRLGQVTSVQSAVFELPSAALGASSS